MKERDHGDEMGPDGLKSIGAFDFSDFFVHHPIENYSDMCVKLQNNTRFFQRLGDISMNSMNSLGPSGFKVSHFTSFFL